jgi:copper chaperone CopZ
VKQALERLAGVKVETVDRTKNEARVRVEDTAVSVDQMVAAIQGAGRFQAKLAGG